MPRVGKPNYKPAVLFEVMQWILLKWFLIQNFFWFLQTRSHMTKNATEALQSHDSNDLPIMMMLMQQLMQMMMQHNQMMMVMFKDKKKKYEEEEDDDDNIVYYLLWLYPINIMLQCICKTYFYNL